MMMGRFCGSVVILMLASYCLGISNRMICEPAQLGNHEQSEGTAQIILQGRPGKRGAVGPTGLRGPRGPPGPVNEEALASLKQAWTEGRSTTEDELDQIRRRLTHIEENYIRKELLELCDLIYEEKCFFLLMPESRVNVPEAEAACVRLGGHLSNIYDREHYRKVETLIRSRSPTAHKYNHIWTGMTIDAQARRIRLTNSQWAPYQKWYPNRPYTPARNNVGIHTDYDTGSSRTGMFDEHESYKLLGGFCEKALT